MKSQTTPSKSDIISEWPPCKSIFFLCVIYDITIQVQGQSHVYLFNSIHLYSWEIWANREPKHAKILFHPKLEEIKIEII